MFTPHVSSVLTDFLPLIYLLLISKRMLRMPYYAIVQVIQLCVSDFARM